MNQKIDPAKYEKILHVDTYVYVGCSQREGVCINNYVTSCNLTWEEAIQVAKAILENVPEKLND